MKWILPGVVCILVAARVSLPYFVTSHVNDILNRIPGYRGHIDDVDINLWRGAYEIEGVSLNKVEGDVPVPFFAARQIDLSIEWGALFEGTLVGEIEFVEPAINFVQGPTGAESQSGGGANFIQTAKDLFPLRINRFDVQDGEVHFRNFHSDPPVDIVLDSFFLHATNLTNSRGLSQTLVASLNATGKVMGSGTIQGRLEIDPFAELPTFNLDFQMKELPLPRLNAFLEAYAAIDVESGIFEVSGEMAAQDGRFTGYVKPVFHDMKVLSVREDDENALRLVWETIIEGVAELFSNPSTENLATRIPLSGNFNDPDVDILTTLGGILKNAFIQALQPGIEGTISLRSAQGQ